ncbi:MAG: HPr family phosphocarrier protein [Alphaproteobacteria bacterium]|nr:HPr family phosphocarrier protein [Alphaproteobacteria bacterium]
MLAKEEICDLVVISNQRGLHARAAAKFVRIVESFNAEVTVTKDGVSVSGRSIMGIMMLAATRGTQLKLSAVGDEALDVIGALSDLVKRKFDED